MALGKLPVHGASYNLNDSRARPIVLAVDAGGGCLGSFTLVYFFLSSFCLSLGDGPI